MKKKPVYKIHQEMWCSDDCGFEDEEFHSRTIINQEDIEDAKKSK